MSGECEICWEHTLDCKCDQFIEKMKSLLDEFEKTHDSKVYGQIMEMITP